MVQGQTRSNVARPISSRTPLRIALFVVGLGLARYGIFVVHEASKLKGPEANGQMEEDITGGAFVLAGLGIAVEQVRPNRQTGS